MQIIQSMAEMPKKLHFGCGSNFLEGYVNLDSHINEDLIPIDTYVMQGVLTSPQAFPRNWFTEIKAEMVMEHIHPDLIPNLLYCFNNIMEDDGRLYIVVPNFVKLAEELLEAECMGGVFNLAKLKMIREVTNEFLYPNMHKGVSHQSIWTPNMADYWLRAEGFKSFAIRYIGDKEYHMEILALKSKDNPYSSPTS